MKNYHIKMLSSLSLLFCCGIWLLFIVHEVLKGRWSKQRNSNDNPTVYRLFFFFICFRRQGLWITSVAVCWPSSFEVVHNFFSGMFDEMFSWQSRRLLAGGLTFDVLLQTATFTSYIVTLTKYSYSSLLAERK